MHRMNLKEIYVKIIQQEIWNKYFNEPTIRGVTIDQMTDFN